MKNYYVAPNLWPQIKADTDLAIWFKNPIGEEICFSGKMIEWTEDEQEEALVVRTIGRQKVITPKIDIVRIHRFVV